MKWERRERILHRYKHHNPQSYTLLYIYVHICERVINKIGTYRESPFELEVDNIYTVRCELLHIYEFSHIHSFLLKQAFQWKYILNTNFELMPKSLGLGNYIVFKHYYFIIIIIIIYTNLISFDSLKYALDKLFDIFFITITHVGMFMARNWALWGHWKCVQFFFLCFCFLFFNEVELIFP